MNPLAIETHALVKRFGATQALDGLDLQVERGEVFGFIGPNGAGKSTTIRVLMDLLRPDGGVARIFGENPALRGAPLRARLGYLPGELTLAGRVTAGEHLRHLAALRGGRGRACIAPLAERFGLELGRTVRTLSRGNKQKVGVIQAFMHAPDLLILDEPTSGLDPLLQHEFLALVRERAASGATVFMSSHVLREVESVADRVAVIRAGRTIDVDSVRGLRHRAGQRLVLTFAAAIDPGPFAALAELRDQRWEGATLHGSLHGSPDALVKLAAHHQVVSWSARDRDLEEMFLDVYRFGAGGLGGGA